MYYELYIDVFFLINFMMDYIVLSFARRMLKCPATHGRICIGAAVGAFTTCVIMILPGMNTFLKFILFHMVSNILMIQTGLKIGWNKTFLRAYVLLYISAFIIGGVMEHLYQYLRVGSLFFALAVAGYYISLGIWNLMTYLAERNVRRLRVRLSKDGREYETGALIDTGNRLRDPATGKPVSIISAKTAVKLGISIPPEEGRYISYQSVGKPDGVMPAVILDAMQVEKKPPVFIERPVVAICEEDITADDYEMLMNPDLL